MSEQTYSKEVLARAKKSGREPWSIQPKAKPTTDRRARLHRALDAVMDRGAARDGLVETNPRQALKNINTTLAYLKKKYDIAIQKRNRVYANQIQSDISSWLYEKSRAEKEIAATK
jgi:hypothetical protein